MAHVLITEDGVFYAKKIEDFEKFGFVLDQDEHTSRSGADFIYDIRGDEAELNREFIRDKYKISKALYGAALYGAPEEKKRNGLVYITWAICGFTLFQVIMMGSKVAQNIESSKAIIDFLNSTF